MPNLLSDPRSWSAKAVATPARFWFIVVAMLALQLAPILLASTGGWANTIAVAAGVVGFQFMCLLALRKLVLQLSGPANTSGA